MPRFVHPPEPVAPPYWRGASDLSGDVGDLIYGSYNRSTNIFVKDGTAVAKRRGYTKAFFERFWGNASVAHGREFGSNYLIIGDGEGVKILSSLVPSPNIGQGYGDPGFPVEDWNRASVADVGASTLSDRPWIEDTGTDGSNNAQFEIGGGTTSANFLKMIQHSADVKGGSLDLLVPMLSPTYVVGMEIDLTNLIPDSKDTSTGIGDMHYINMAMGLPLRYPLDPNETQINRQWPIRDIFKDDGGVVLGTGADGRPWMGTGVRIILSKRDAKTEIRAKCFVFTSTQKEGETGGAAREGGYYKQDDPNNPFTAGDSATDWPGGEKLYLEFGREAFGSTVVRHRMKLWNVESVAEARHADPIQEVNMYIGRDQVWSDGKYVPILSPDGNAGHFGISADLTDGSGSAGYILFDNFTCKENFTG